MIATVLGVGLWVGASIARADDDPPAYVLVQPNTEVQTAIDGPSLPYGALGNRANPLLFERTGESGDWVKLANATTHIHDLEGLAWLRPYQLNLYVQTEKLAPVLAKLHTHTDEDGLQVLLLPGRPLEQEAPDRFEFQSSRLSGFGPVAPEAVSDRFQISAIEDWMAVEEAWVCSLDNGLLPAKQGCWLHEKGYSYSRAERVYRLRTDEEGLIALIKKGDWRFDELRVSPESAHRDEPPQRLSSDYDSGMLMALLGGQTTPKLEKVQLREGATIYWPDGSIAGQVRESHELYEAQLMVSESQMRCTPLPWAMPEHLQTGIDVMTSEPQTESGSLVLCFGEKDLVPVSR